MAEFRIKDEVGASVFAILLGLTLLCLTAWIFGSGGCSNRRSQTTLRSSSQEQAQENARLASSLDESKMRVEQLVLENERLKSEFEEADIPGVKIDMQNLQSRLSDEKKKRENLVARYEKELSLKKDYARSLEQKIHRLGEVNIKLSKPSASTDSEQLAALRAEIAALKKKEQDCAAQKTALQDEISSLKDAFDQAKYAKQLKRAGDFPELDLPLLVNDPSQLHPAVRPLFIRLRSMGDTPADREKVYVELAKEGKTEPLHLVPFASGSAEVAGGEMEKLAGKVSSTGKGAKYLVVGYASTEGDAKGNYELSSKRASSVAQQVAAISKLDGKDVQAVYFGQTSRFSADQLEPNRVVEVWKVK